MHDVIGPKRTVILVRRPPDSSLSTTASLQIEDATSFFFRVSWSQDKEDEDICMIATVTLPLLKDRVVSSTN